MEIHSKQVVATLRTEVLIVGSGSAGATAAIAAAQSGADTLVVERYGFMGGISTQVLDTFYGFFTPGKLSKKVIGGVPDLVVDELDRRGVSLRRPNTYGAGDGITYDPETLKIVWESLAQGSGARLLYHSFVMDALREGDRIMGVVVATKRGWMKILADCVVDASGDADVAAYAGAPFEGPEEGPIQSLTTTFRMLGVDDAKARAIGKNELHELMREAGETGEYDLPRREGSIHITPFDGVMAANMTRVGDVDATDPEQLTRAEIEGRRQALEYARFLHDFVPGYEHAFLADLSNQIGVRESRRIFGEYRLTRDDVLSARKFEDAVAQCGAPIEDHHAGADTKWEYLPDGETYDIPYRCLLPLEVEGLLVAGRCLSAEHDAHASVRSMGQCMAMGQASGVAAALSCRRGDSPRSLSTSALRDRLVEMGAIL